ncbi:MAG: transposase [Aureispira sp.]
MTYDPNIHHRRSTRLFNYDYAQAGHYFITICCYEHRCLFGKIKEGKMQLNTLGKLVQQEWEATPNIRPNVELGPYVIMPNHLHAIVHITHQLYDSPQPLGSFQSPSQTLGAIVRGYKGSVMRQLYHLLETQPEWNTTLFHQYQVAQLQAQPTIWHTNYHDHIIRSEKAYQSIQNYIEQNPANWRKDYLNQAS